jgi:uncharacterized RDD family membrane protein YckC
VSSIAPGWYKDPAEPTTQRYWDGEGWLGAALPAEATPPAGPPAPEPVDPPVVVAPPVTVAPVPPAGIGGVPGGPMPPGPYYPGPLPPGYAFPIQAAPPHPRPHGLAVAGIGARLVARLVDIFAVLVLVAIANAWLAREWWSTAVVPFVRAAEEMQRTGGPAPDGTDVYTLAFAMCAVAALVWFAYEVPSIANSGQTLGKRILGIKVVRLESADPLGFGRSLRRWSRLGLPTLLWPCYGAGFVLQGIDCFFIVIDWRLRQALHDRQAGTVVVQVPRADPAGPAQLENSAPGGHDAHSR